MYEQNTFQKLTEDVRDILLHNPAAKDALAQTDKAADDEVGRFDVIISTGDIDRHGERIDPNGMDFSNFRENPVVLFGHDHRGLPIGRADEVGVERREGKDVVRAQGRFAPASANEQAQQVRKLHDLEIMNTTSVGIIVNEIKIGEDDEKTVDRASLEKYNALKSGETGEAIDRAALKEKGLLTKDDETITITKSELLEFSFVPVPANPFATAIRENGYDMEELTNKGLIFATTKDGDDPMDDEDEEEFTKHAEQRQKSPACRMSDETEEECRQRKIPEIMEENPDMEQDQAVAIASEMCETPCEEEEEKAYKAQKQDDEADTPEAVKEAGAVFNDLNNTVNDEIVQASRKIMRTIENALGNDDQKAAAVANKEGRVLSKKNREAVQAARDALQSVLDADDKERDEHKQTDTNPDADVSGGENNDGGSGDDAGAAAGESPKHRSMREGYDAGLEDAKTFFMVRDTLRAANTAMSDALKIMNQKNPRRRGNKQE